MEYNNNFSIEETLANFLVDLSSSLDDFKMRFNLLFLLIGINSFLLSILILVQ